MGLVWRWRWQAQARRVSLPGTLQGVEFHSKDCRHVVHRAQKVSGEAWLGHLGSSRTAPGERCGWFRAESTALNTPEVRRGQPGGLSCAMETVTETPTVRPGAGQPGRQRPERVGQWERSWIVGQAGPGRPRVAHRYSQLPLRPQPWAGVSRTRPWLSLNVVAGQGQDPRCRLMRAVAGPGAARAQRKPFCQSGVGRQPKHQDTFDEEKTHF